VHSISRVKDGEFKRLAHDRSSTGNGLPGYNGQIMCDPKPVSDLHAEDRIRRDVFGFGTPDDDERGYWRTRSPEERLAAVELLRRINYGEAATSARLQRVFESAELGRR
jgi:hypothetical protein